MKAFYVAAVLWLLTVPAYAQPQSQNQNQTPSINMMRDEAVRTPEEREKDKAVNDAYKAQMSKIPDQKASSDPWGTVRSADTPKAATAARKKNQN